MKRANQPRKQIFSVVSLISAYQHSINIFELSPSTHSSLPSRSRCISANLFFSPSYLYFQSNRVSFTRVSFQYFSRKHSRGIGTKVSQFFFQFYIKNLEIYKKEEKSIAGLKFNPKDIVIISGEFSKIEESIERLNSKTWVCVQEISRRIAI